MRWGVTVLAIALLITLVRESGCSTTSLGPQQVSDFNITNDNQAAPVIKMPGTPTASFDAQPLTGITHLKVILDASGSSKENAPIISYAWDFGDGQTGSGTAVSHVYSTAGTYTATLTVTDNQGATGQTTMQVVVNPVAVKYLVH